MSTPTPDYGEPWRKRKTWFCCPFADREGQVVETEQSRNLERILACVNALAGVQDPAAHLAGMNAAIERWESELSAVMPLDFKDWFQNDKSEWPLVARKVIESLREREAFCMKVIEQQAETLKVMNDAPNESNAFQHLARDYAKLKAEREDWMRLAFDMLSTFKEGKDFIITQERVECWRAEWSRISGLNYDQHA